VVGVLAVFRKRSLGRRFIALSAAYAFVVSFLIAGYVAAAAAGAVGGNSVAVICHGAAPSSTPDDESNGKLCGNDCCTGCLSLIAALPPPPDVVAFVQSCERSFAPPAIVGLAGRTAVKSHQSRAPPQTA
jgi:hypothetical protein